MPPAETSVFRDVAALADSYATPPNPPYDPNSLEAAKWLAYCAEGLGFATTISTVPGQSPTLVAKVTAEQRDRWAVVEQECTQVAVRRGWVEAVPSTPEELRQEYQRLREVNECLDRIGYGTDPPSEEAFVAGEEWNVYANTPLGSELAVAPSAGDKLPADVRRQLEIQEECSVWGGTGTTVR